MAVRVRDVIRDWPSFRKGLMRESYESVCEKIAGTAFEVIQASKWNADIDGGVPAVEVSMTDLDRRIGYFLHLVRDTGVTVVGKRKRRNVSDLASAVPQVVLEPGDDFWKYFQAKAGASTTQMLDAVAAGPLGRKMHRRATKENTEIRRKLKAEQDRNEALEAEIEALEGDLKSVRRGSDRERELQNQVAVLRQQVRHRHLEEQARLYGSV